MISSRKGQVPIYIKIGIQPADSLTESGPLTLPVKNEVYVCLSHLPDDLRRKVETSVQTLMSAI